MFSDTFWSTCHCFRAKMWPSPQLGKMSIYLGISTGGKLSEKKSFANLCSQCTRDSVAAVVCEPESRSACGQVGTMINCGDEKEYVPSCWILSHAWPSRVQLPSWDLATRLSRLPRHLWAPISSAASTSKQKPLLIQIRTLKWRPLDDGTLQS